jgi:hypothetical protein
VASLLLYFTSRTPRASLVFGKLNARQPLVVRSYMPEGGVIFSDGIEADYVAFNAGAEATLTFFPAADAFTDAGNPATNYGRWSMLRTYGSQEQRSYLRFAINGIGGRRVLQAVLRLYANGWSPVGFDAQAVADNTWGEATLNYHNQPALGVSIGSVGEVPAERLRRWRLFLTDKRAACRFPFLGQGDPTLVQVRSAPADLAVVFVLNTSDAPAERTYTSEAPGLPSPGFVHAWLDNQTWPEPVTALLVRLQPHDCALFLVSPQPWGEIPERLG